MSITTIIPTFRRPDSLKKAIQSVLGQTYPHFQVCVYDNASGDTTADVVSALMREDSRIKYHCHDNNIGAAENFQYALSRVETPFFSFLSDDDFLLPEFYETAFNGFKKYPDAAFSSGAVIDMNEKEEILGVILSKWPEKEYYSAPDGLLEMIGKYSNWVGTLFRREIIEKIGPLDLTLKAIDIDYMLRAARHFSFAISKKPCAVFMQHPSSYSSLHGFKLIWPGWHIIISKLKEDPLLSSETKRIAEQKLQVDLQNLLVMNVLRAIERKNFDEATLVANVYNQNCSRRVMKLLLSIMIKGCKVLPPFQKTLKFLLQTRRRIIRSRPL